MKFTHKTGWQFQSLKAMAFVTAFGLAACSEAEKSATSTEESAREITLLLNADGTISVKGAPGAVIDRQCSLDPKSEKRCPFYDDDSKIHIQNINNILLMQYRVNPLCYLIGQNTGAAQLICYP